MSKLVNIAGMRFGRLTALRCLGLRGKKTFWDFLCDCGKTHATSYSNVKWGGSTSCGCVKSKGNHTTHGLSKKHSFEYSSWNAMMNRCYMVTHESYHAYGGSGILVCERWKNFANFFSDMGPRPPGTTLDRIISVSGYMPGNCRWATIEVQSNNKRSCRYYIWRGQRMSMSQIARANAVPLETLRMRLLKMSIKEAVSYVKAS